jgi:hypothetical protein
MNTDTPRTDEWETYCDESYYHLWRVRRKNERGFNDGYHVHNGDEARALVDLLNKQDSELTAARADAEDIRDMYYGLLEDHKAVTEQRNEARRLAEKYRNLSCDSQDEADETLLPWEITNPNEL